MDSQKFIRDAVDVVTQAIEEDNAENYEKAYLLYKKALEFFIVGLKYEKNPVSKQKIMERVAGYIARAEQLKKSIDDAKAAPTKKAAAAASGGGKAEDEEAKMKGALAGAILSEKPNVKWSDVAGLHAAKDALKEAVILPARFPQLFTGKRRPWKGILLYGPPGTGKSYLAKAVATEADSTFFSVSSSDLVSKWQGESEKLVRNLFEMAREAKPAIIFIDEIDSLCSSRSEGESDSARRIKTEFLVQMQGVGKTHDGILVLGATNVPWELDPAMRRRFEKRIYIPLPDVEACTYMLKLHLGDTPNCVTDDDWQELGAQIEGYSGSDISVVVREALMEPLRKCQLANFFQVEQDGGYMPITRYPSCPYCHPKLSTCGAFCRQCSAPCARCGAVRISLMDVQPELLRVPVVEPEDFARIIDKGGGATVSPDELDQFVKWTKEFGQEG